MSQNPWWHPSDDDLGRDEPLPVIIRLAPMTALLFRCGVRASAISTGDVPSSRPRHTRLTTAERYTHVATLQMKDASERMDEALWGEG